VAKETVILGCENESKTKQLKDSVSEKLGNDFEIVKPRLN